MSPPDGHRPWPHRSWATRWLPPALAVVLIAVVALAGTAYGRNQTVSESTAPTYEELANLKNNPDLPITYEEAKAAGTVDQYDWGERCDVTRRYNDTDQTLARLAIPSTYAPPCVPVWGGDKPWVSQGGITFTDNGGATAPGVTADTIRVVFYVAAEQDVAKQLQQFGVVDSEDETLDGIRRLADMSNALYETYGRRVEVVPFYASGDGRSPSAARADAVRVVEMGAFASIGGPSQTSAYLLELARNHVLCIQCGYAPTNDVMFEAAPYAWGYAATPDELLFGTFGLGVSMVTGHPAQFAGDPATRSEIRRLGVVHYEQDPPIFGPLKAAAIDRYSKQGASADTIIQYILDPNTLNEQAQAIIGRLKRDGITSVVFLGDPLMPRLLMQQAEKQDYHPEWMFTGTALTDTSVVARLYNQNQMAHAFGASSSPVRTVPEISEPWKLYQWWYGSEPRSPKTMAVYGPVLQLLFLGIHMAGPNLSAQTFAGGLFKYPPTGQTNVTGKTAVELFLGGYIEGNTAPAIRFGPRPDGTVKFSAVDDFTVAWWNPDAEGPDENGKVGKGLWMFSGMGMRLPLDNPALPSEFGEGFLFKKNLSEVGGPLYEQAKALGIPDLPIATPILEKTPKLNQLPDYPVWAESPAAQGHS